MKNKHTNSLLFIGGFAISMHNSYIFLHLHPSFKIVFAYLRNLCYNISVKFMPDL